MWLFLLIFSTNSLPSHSVSALFIPNYNAFNDSNINDCDNRYCRQANKIDTVDEDGINDIDTNIKNSNDDNEDADDIHIYVNEDHDEGKEKK